MSPELAGHLKPENEEEDGVVGTHLKVVTDWCLARPLFFW
jgi:hypothetical protein